MASYEQFAFEKARTLNLVGISLALVTTLIYHYVDAVLLPSELHAIATSIRLGINTPLTIITFYFCYKRLARPFMGCATAIMFTNLFWWYWAFHQENEVRLPGLLAISAQVLTFANVLLQLHYRVHIFILLMTCGLTIAAVMVNQDQSFVHLATFSIGMAGLIALTFIWVYFREAHTLRMYRLSIKADRRLLSRKSWNTFLSSTISDVSQTSLAQVETNLAQLESNQATNHLLLRAKESASELRQLLKRFSQTTDWSAVVKKSDQRDYSVSEHILRLLPELRIKHSGSELALDVTHDFNTNIEPELLTRLIANLTENACRHAIPGTVVQMSIEQDKTVAVKNKGPQLTKPLRELIKPGAQSSSPGRFGLGLYVCAKICQSNGIELVAQNTKDGVCMQLRFEPNTTEAIGLN